MNLLMPLNLVTEASAASAATADASTVRGKKAYAPPAITILMGASIETGSASNQPEATNGVWALGS